MKSIFEEQIHGRCPVEVAIKLISGKYKSSILWFLRDGALRYGDLQARLPQASPKMLAEQLSELVADKLVSKIAYPVVPPRTEYSLTRHGLSAIPLLQAMSDFGREYLIDNN